MSEEHQEPGIIHVDMDAFYASVEQRDNPQLAGLPVVVGGTAKDRGVVAAASYAARKFGVLSAMPSSTALKLCPDLVFVPMRMQHYRKVSEQIRDIFHRYTPLVEPLSLDEAFLDVRGSTQLFGEADVIGTRIKDDIRRELALTASVGIGPNKFTAKIASDLQKPDGFVKVSPPLATFLDPLPVSRLWGIGQVTERKLTQSGIRTIRQFRLANTDLLKSCVGNALEQLMQLANGQDDRQVVPSRPSVTMSRETTFAKDINDIGHLENTLLNLTEHIATRLRNQNLGARTVGIKLRFSNFKTITRSKSHASATNVTQVIWKCVRELLHAALSKPFKIRLIGIQASSLEQLSDSQSPLIEHDDIARQKKIDEVVDRVNRKFGDAALHRGAGQN